MATLAAAEDTKKWAQASRCRAVAAAMLVACTALLLGGQQALDIMSGGECPYARETGRPCAGCGGTRAYGDAVRGCFVQAAKRNLLGACAGACVWLMTVGSAGTLLTGRAVFLKASAAFVTVMAPVAFVAGVVGWWLVWRPHVF